MNRPVMVVGTPGRLAELSREGVLATHRTAALVLDEVDQLLEPHFREDLGRILEHTGAQPHARRCGCAAPQAAAADGQRPLGDL